MAVIALVTHILVGILMVLISIGLIVAGLVVGMVISEEDSARFRAKMVERVGKELELTEPQKQRLVVLGERLRDQRVALIGKTIDPRSGPRIDSETPGTFGGSPAIGAARRARRSASARESLPSRSLRSATVEASASIAPSVKPQ